ncbi:kinase-like protein [Xylona heveae TC161]|uniref:Kinase-like protein n=1 Tax=Xylona heveae (strain CBS 132557 / TC161) TaxID=1328760 RepID=A0A165AGA4_XYLHT|nr:kinase-like protein [Xylona heveae TC161]KZF20427.1 kinase-like protein [Xylona heveae TC161]
MDRVRWIYQVTNAIAWLKQLRIAHCNLRPPNILLDDRSNAKLCNFDSVCNYGEYIQGATEPYYKWLDSGSFGVAGAASKQFVIGSCGYFIFISKDLVLCEAKSDLHGILIFGSIIQKCWKSSYLSIADLKCEIVTSVDSRDISDRCLSQLLVGWADAPLETAPEASRNGSPSASTSLLRVTNSLPYLNDLQYRVHSFYCLLYLMLNTRKCWQSISAVLRRLLSASQRLALDKYGKSENLFRQTSGRWLWNEAHQMSQHTRSFNESALKEVAARAMGINPSSHRIRIKKLAEGASNKVFVAAEQGRRLIIKMPDPLVPEHFITASEVATMEYMRSEIGIPVPEVLAWSISSDNPVGCEYIIMEEVPGIALNTTWHSLDVDQKFAIVDQILSLQTRLLQGSSGFSGYGSLYFTEDAITLGLSKRQPVMAKVPPRFCLGPLANNDFSDKRLKMAGVDGGPWHLPKDYLTAVAESFITKVKTSQHELERGHFLKEPFSFAVNTCSDTSPAAAIELLKQYEAAVPYLVSCYQEPVNLSRPALWHRDLHSGNIFVAPSGKITGIIDWQGTVALPLFLQARIPQFLAVESGSLLLELPDGFDSMTEPEKKRIWNNYRQSMLQQYYLSSLPDVAPEVSQILEGDPFASIRQLVTILGGGSFSRETDVLVLRELLIHIQRTWPEMHSRISSPPPCPISIGPNELRQHRIDGRRWNEFKDLLQHYNIPVAREGWVPKEEFEMQKRQLKVVLKDILNSLEDEKERQEFLDNIGRWDITDWKGL